ncbi:Peptidyl-glycine alpha-amidating monooxygenase [Halotydeus destructor]|nr:Peptidyl-glycine alpha-amidating monooxygenase [Halotydeus destructor]
MMTRHRYSVSNKWIAVVLIAFVVVVCDSFSSRRKLIHHDEFYDRSSEDLDEKANLVYNYSQSPSWNRDNNFGQISAVDINKQGNVVIFHRGSHVWNADSFDNFDEYKKIKDGPIVKDTIVEINPENGQTISSWGSNLFYMPHGLSFDSEENVWLTDVALHQVFKFTKVNHTSASLTLGERFKPGNTQERFCKPTSVAVDPETGDFYVADGYCNERIVRFGKGGNYLDSFGDIPPSYQAVHRHLAVPHKIVLVQKTKQLFVADRENGRIVSYSYPGGEFISLISSELYDRLFSVSYSPCNHGTLFAVNGLSFSDRNMAVKGFVIDPANSHIVSSFAPTIEKTFAQPHDIVASKDCRTVYVVEIGPNRLYKFDNNAVATGSRVELPVLSHPASAHLTLNDIATNKFNNVEHSDAVENRSSSNVTHSKVAANAPSSVSSSQPLPESSNLVAMALLSLPLLGVMIYSSYRCCCRQDGKMTHFSASRFNVFRSKRNAHFDLGRLLSDPEKSGFNRVSLDEHDDIDLDNQSDSDVEEFNIRSARKT